MCTYAYYFNIQTNTFQCVLATSATASFVMFLYADGKIQWSKSALAGINAGDGVNYTIIPGSRTPNIITISRTSNVGILGVWMFKVAEGTYVIYTYNVYHNFLLIIYIATYIYSTCIYIHNQSTPSCY